uniref:CUB domain-containing protein n=1 Tax=Caenorhabditis tropicalis TaxID=1561998 RepID=A0A1I7UIS8_9PELO
MIWIKLLFLLIFFEFIQAYTRHCAQCVAGNFLFRRNLMQDSSIGMAMGWVAEWKGTDCLKGTVNSIPCDHACLQITILKHPLEENAVEGIMMDCSDMMIHSSPDLPKEIDFKAYDDNAVFSAKRRSFTINYNFTMRGFESVEKIREDHASIILPYYREDYATSTVVILLILFVLTIVSGTVWVCHTLFFMKNDDHRRRYPVPGRKIEGETMELQGVHVNTTESDATSSAPSAPTNDSESHHDEENGNVLA